VSVIRVKWEVFSGKPEGVYFEELPKEWPEWDEGRQAMYLMDVENEAFFDIATVTVDVVEPDPAEPEVTG
jgi:hypothetical protein